MQFWGPILKAIGSTEKSHMNKDIYIAFYYNNNLIHFVKRIILLLEKEPF